MRNWYFDYHHFQMLRLVSLAVVFGLIMPGLGLLIGAGSVLTTRLAELATVKPGVNATGGRNNVPAPRH